MEFARRSPRGTIGLTIPAQLKAGKVELEGNLADISCTGLSLVLPRVLSARTPVLINIETSAVLSRPMATLAGHISYCARVRTPDGRLGYRAGVALDPLPENVQQQLAAFVTRFASGTGSHPAVKNNAPDPLWAESPEGRERLYQLALTRLAAGEYDAARQAARWSLAVMPHARHVRALMCRANAEESLAAGNLDNARREVSFAKNLLPADAEVIALGERVEATSRPATKSFIGRLFGGNK